MAIDAAAELRRRRPRRRVVSLRRGDEASPSRKARRRRAGPSPARAARPSRIQRFQRCTRLLRGFSTGPQQPPRRVPRRRRRPRRLALDRHERGPRVGVPARRVHLVARRGVERRHPGLHARVALPVGRPTRRRPPAHSAATSGLLVPRQLARAPLDSTGLMRR
jgi:hypothetical protein